MILPDHSNLVAQIIIGSHHVQILTGEFEANGSPEVLIGARGTSDLGAIKRLIRFCDQALEENAKRQTPAG